MGSLDLPDEPDKPMRATEADTGGADRESRRPRELPDPDERSRAYDAAGTNVSAETPDEASPGRRPDMADQRSYWDEVPRFQKVWADHEGTWSEKADESADRSGDPAELPATTAEAVSRIREAEPELSADAQAFEQENKHGGWLAGFERRLKGEGRIQEKITEKLAAEKLSVEPRMTASEALREMADVLRYTYCFQSENYTRGYYDIKDRFESRGHEMYYSENYWTNPEYKGVNTRWVTPGGQRFEVQFHTPESFHAKHEVTHLGYERIRNTETSKAERRELHAFQEEVCSRIRAPDGATDIPNYRREGF
ncbi:MAG: hypothetical protein ACRDOU_14210 [Streptosporangiaceae bacterium]